MVGDGWWAGEFRQLPPSKGVGWPAGEVWLEETPPPSADDDIEPARPALAGASFGQVMGRESSATGRLRRWRQV